MTLNKKILITYILLLFAKEGLAVSVDYLVEDESLIKDVTTNVSNVSTVSLTSSESDYDEKESAYTKTFIKKAKQVNQKRKTTTIKKGRRMYNQTKTTLPTEPTNSSSHPTNTPEPLSRPDTADDYDVYGYPQKLIGPTQKMCITCNKNNISTFSDYESDDKSERLAYGSLYNLEPAVDRLVLNGLVRLNVAKNTWYVVENYPCWDFLPLLYGEVEPTAHASEVFQFFSASVKNVKHEKEKESKSSNFLNIHAVVPSANKWCINPPCFGDHIMCLFPKHDNRGICEPKYKVSTLSILEQKAVVNTLNSMRNKVAKGTKSRYPFLPSAANMQQVIYDVDLENMAVRWLQQCLPGPAPCLSLDENFVSQLECTRTGKRCCYKDSENCTPAVACFIQPVIGCLHFWFWTGSKLRPVDVKCGQFGVKTFMLAQLLYAKTNKIGCAYGTTINGDKRVICNFAPGAPFYLETKYYCGLLTKTEDHQIVEKTYSSVHLDYLQDVYNHLKTVKQRPNNYSHLEKPDNFMLNPRLKRWGAAALRKLYSGGWVRRNADDYRNGSLYVVAQLVSKYIFREDAQARCDVDEPIYAEGPPGSHCALLGRKYYYLCYDFRDPTPGYRVAAILASVALFSLILYDLFSGVMRQLNN